MKAKAGYIAAAAAVLIAVASAGGLAFAHEQPSATAKLSAEEQIPPPSATASTAAAPPPTAQLDPAARKQRRDDFLNQLAQNLNISRSSLNSALTTTFGQEINKAVTANQLTADQAARLKKQIGKDRFPIGLHLGNHANQQTPATPGQ